MIDEDAPQPCLKCGKPVSKTGAGDPEARGCVFMGDAGPAHWEGMQFCRQMEITVCGECLTEAGRGGRVLLYSVLAPDPEVSRWEPAGLRSVRGLER